jgi:hypothetical protein
MIEARMRSLHWVYGTVAILALAGCRHRVLGRPDIPESSLPKSMRGPDTPEKCAKAAVEGAPLLTELPATDKANLEILTRSGAVAVAFTGCQMQVLYNCRLPGKYYWYAVSPTSDSFEINDEDTLYAKLPLGAVGLGADLQRWGRLTVQTSVSGQLRLGEIDARDVHAQGECARATHVIGALSVGAFVMSTSGGGSAGGGADVYALGAAGGKVTSGASVVRAAGQPETCGQASELAPPQSCRSPIQAFLWPVQRGAAARSAVAFTPPPMPAPAPAMPAPSVPAPPAVATMPATQDELPMPPPPAVAAPPAVAVTPPPPPTQPAPQYAPQYSPQYPSLMPPMMAQPMPSLRGAVQVELVSAHANSRWDIYVDDEVICSTPCTRFLDPGRPIYMRSRSNGLGAAPDELSVPHLFPAAKEGGVQLQARPTMKGEWVTGTTFASLGGMTMLTGITLAGVGCSDPVDRGELCGPGLISLGVGSLVTAGAIWLILDSLPKAVVAPLRQYVAYSN